MRKWLFVSGLLYLREAYMISRFLLLGVVGALSVPLQAKAILVYSDRPTWEAAIGTVTGSEDFSTFAIDTSFDGSSLALAAGMTIGSIGADGRGDHNLVDVTPLRSLETDVNTTNDARVLGGPFGPNQSVTPFISFSSPVWAFGADFKNLNDDLLRTYVDLYNGTTNIASIEPVVLPSGNLRFLGFTSETSVTEIRFRWAANDAYGIDNIAIARIPIPEPATLALLGLGMASLAFVRRRRNAAC
jgi:hypothetical protein